MKRFMLIPVMLVLLSTMISAAAQDLTDQWLLIRVDLGDSVQELYQDFSFCQDGTTKLQGRPFGTWEMNSNKNQITIKSGLIKEFSAAWNIIRLTDKELVLKSNKGTLYFTVFNRKEIEKDNNSSGLTGVWELTDENDENGKYYIYFQKPDKLTIEYMDYGYTDTSHGTWIYNKKDNLVVIITGGRILRGSNKILKLSDNRLTLKNSKITLIGKRLEQNGGTREKLDIDTGFCDPENDAKQIGYDNFSWFDYEAKTEYLKNISRLNYRKSVYLDEFDAFTTEDLSAKIYQDGGSISMDGIFSNLPEGEYTEDNIFYPLEEPFIYYSMGEKEVTVPAGTFKCMVVDTDSYSSGNRTRLYMIENRPGVYAKIINIEDGFDGEIYTMYELESIEGNFTLQKNRQIIGNWLLTEITTGDKTTKTSTNFEFINDGRIAVTKSGSMNFFNWRENGNGVTLDFGDGEQDFTISKLTGNELILENPELRYKFIKMNTDLNSGEDFKFTAYWMLINTSSPYSMIHLTKDHKVFDIEGIYSSPLSENYAEMAGKWMYDNAGGNLVFNTDKYRAICSGSLKIVKLDDEQMVLNNQGYRMVFIKIDTENNIKNNKESGFTGIWKITGNSGKVNYYDFTDPFLFRKGNSLDDMPKRGLWFYNPKNKNLFLGYMMHQLEGFSVITEITGDSIIFENGLKAERVK